MQIAGSDVPFPPYKIYNFLLAEYLQANAHISHHMAQRFLLPPEYLKWLPLLLYSFFFEVNQNHKLEAENETSTPNPFVPLLKKLVLLVAALRNQQHLKSAKINHIQSLQMTLE